MAEITIIPTKNRSDEIIRTAAYARVSSDSEDQLNSFAAQIRYYTEMLQNSTNTVFVDMYADEGITGTSTAKRTEFQRLMNDCRKGKIDRILAKSISRFARNTKDSLRTARELKTLGVSVYFEKENIDTGEISSEMLLAIYSQFAQEESMSISKNVRIGVQKRMMDGTFKSSSAPYGYIYNSGEIIPDPEKTKTVRQIFEWYSKGIGAETISAILNQKNIPAPHGQQWRTAVILMILTNEKYIGDTLLQKSFTTDSLPFRHMPNRGEKPKYYVSSTHQPIIERKLFDEVQQLINLKKPNIDFTPQTNVFTKKIKCICGGTFRRKKCGEKIYWVCRNHDHTNLMQCEIRRIREIVFQKAFISLFNKLWEHCKVLLVSTLRQLELLSERQKSNNTQLATLRKEIAEIKQQFHLLTTLNLQGTLDSAYFAARSQELDRKLNTAQKQLHANLDNKENERICELRKLIGILDRAESITEFDEMLFGQIIDKITVLSETEIRFDLIGGISFTEQIRRW